MRLHIEKVVTDGAVPARKALLQALVHEIRVEGRDRVVPCFRVPGGADPKVRALARSVPPALHNANLSPVLSGDVIELADAYAKVRRSGYRSNHQ
jgi:hypothetical protein